MKALIAAALLVPGFVNASPNEDLTYQVCVVSSAIAGATVGGLTSKYLDGDTGWGWSKTDVAMELVFLGLVSADAMQTSWFRARGFEELNPLLGRTPTDRDIMLGVGASALGHVLITAALPKPYRSMWQGAGIGVEIYATAWNKMHGVGIKIPW